MKKGEKKKQQKALKKRTRAKEAHKRIRAAGLLPPLHLRQARTYPIEGCWVQEDWQKSGLAVVVVARRQPDGRIAFGNYLVDHYCLGLKNCLCNADIPPEQFRKEFLPEFYRSTARPISIPTDLAHEIVYGAIDYAVQFGFQPHRDFRLCQYVLDPPEAHPRSGKVEFGKDGKPLFISGPYDNVDVIMNQLRRTAGEGNFNYLIGIGPSDGFFIEEGDEEQEE